ncbi:MAG TPA: hypothetical protein DEQ87_06720 [Algoriphagus sp.]|jgi:hypothetical protein|uniref:hypothetical protein n=1 Tax=uncultured Algoriphagus sp. TaxID=417365 RepID=UPI000C68DE11|nr:hypothetical protein [Algoriphagus sp.]MAN87174.1 hypothetical protein [Algoriphagus sp.]HAH38973.1 hypothetical protein [Algoriphagus sp.]HAS60446.1 hypothetical protein [Algoriphagus sp.]HCB44858.1 hypothetical protein [Algoriphagus sp.]
MPKALLVVAQNSILGNWWRGPIQSANGTICIKSVLMTLLGFWYMCLPQDPKLNMGSPALDRVFKNSTFSAFLATSKIHINS